MTDFLRAYEEHVFAVYGFLAHRTRSRDDAEDLTQATFERALKAWSRFDPEQASERTWLLAIARNVYIDHRRRGSTRKETSLGDRDLAAAGHVAGPEETLGMSPDLAAALAKLGRRQREAIALRFGGDLPINEIAEVMEISLANAQQILSRGMRRLRSLLAEQPPGSARPAR